jgi:hypothetical protein
MKEKKPGTKDTTESNDLKKCMEVDEYRAVLGATLLKTLNKLALYVTRRLDDVSKQMDGGNGFADFPHQEFKSLCELLNAIEYDHIDKHSLLYPLGGKYAERVDAEKHETRQAEIRSELVFALLDKEVKTLDDFKNYDCLSFDLVSGDDEVLNDIVKEFDEMMKDGNPVVVGDNKKIFERCLRAEHIAGLGVLPKKEDVSAYMAFSPVYWDTRDRAELAKKPHFEVFCSKMADNELLQSA